MGKLKTEKESVKKKMEIVIGCILISLLAIVLIFLTIIYSL